MPLARKTRQPLSIPPPSYVRRHLVEHADAGGVVDERLMSVEFLPFADGSRLRAVLRATGTDLLAARAWAHVAHVWRWDSPGSNADALNFVLRGLGAPRDRSALTGGWTTRWANIVLDAGSVIGRHLHGVSSIAAVTLADGRAVAVSGGDDDVIRTWDLRDGSGLGSALAGHDGFVTGVAAMELPNGNCLVASGSLDRTVRVWDLNARNQIRLFVVEPTWVTSVALLLMPDGTPIAGCGCGDATVKFCDITSGNITTATHTSPDRAGISDRVLAIAGGISENGTGIFVSAGTDGTLRAWDPRTAATLGEPWKAHDGWATSVSFTKFSDGRVVVVSSGIDGTVRMWNTLSGVPIGDPLDVDVRRVDALSTLVSGNGRSAAVIAGDAKIEIWDLESRYPKGPALLSRGVKSLTAAVLNDGRPMAVTAGRDNTVRLWDLTGGISSGSLPSTVANATSASVFDVPNARRLVITGSWHTKVGVWDYVDGTPIGDPIDVAKMPANAVGALLPDAQPVIVTADGSAMIGVWDMTGGRLLGSYRSGHEGSIDALAATALPNGRYAAVTGGRDGTLRVLDLEQGVAILGPMTGHLAAICAVTTSTLTDGRVIAVSGSGDNSARTWDLANGNRISRPMVGHLGSVLAVDVVTPPNGPAVVVTGGNDGTARAWNLLTSDPIGAPLDGHTGYVHAVRGFVMPDGRMFAITGDDLMVRVWSLTSGLQCAATLQVTEPVTSLAVVDVSSEVVELVVGGSGMLARVQLQTEIL